MMPSSPFTFIFILRLILHWPVISSSFSVLSRSHREATLKNYGVAFASLLESKKRNWQTTTSTSARFVGTGFSFDDGEQVLVSVQKPLGLILEQEEGSPVTVGQVDPNGSAGGAGVKEGDILVAVQNASVETQTFESVMELLSQAPKVVNLRFTRPK